jgi:hypothetical protein
LMKRVDRLNQVEVESRQLLAELEQLEQEQRTLNLRTRMSSMNMNASSSRSGGSSDVFRRPVELIRSEHNGIRFLNGAGDAETSIR